MGTVVSKAKEIQARMMMSGKTQGGMRGIEGETEGKRRDVIGEKTEGKGRTVTNLVFSQKRESVQNKLVPKILWEEGIKPLSGVQIGP